MLIRTGYSFRIAYGFLEDVMARIETPYAPITDRASMFGHNPWRKLCKENGKRPIYGIEVGITDNFGAKKPAVGHAVLLAGDSLEPINRAFSVATAQFRYQPLLTYNDLASLPTACHVLLGRGLDIDALPDREMFLLHGPSTEGRMLEAADSRGVGQDCLQRQPLPRARGPASVHSDHRAAG